MVETRSDDHSLFIACNRRHFAFQITHIASPFKGESKQNHSTIINKEQRNTHRSAYLLYCNHEITVKHHRTQQSLLNECNHSIQPLFPSQTSQWTQTTTPIKSTPPNTLQFPSQNKHTPSSVERITPPTYRDQECTWRCYQPAPACRSVSSPRTPHGSTS